MCTACNRDSSHTLWRVTVLASCGRGLVVGSHDGILPPPNRSWHLTIYHSCPALPYLLSYVSIAFPINALLGALDLLKLDNVSTATGNPSLWCQVHSQH